LTPWLQRDVPLDGAGTDALVVGVSRYRNLPQSDDEPSPTDRETFGLRQARTPATSAWKFANWLASSYNNPMAPLRSVRLLLSPSPWELENVPALAELPDLQAATRDNVAEAVDEWHNAAAASNDNVAVLYASGHGIQVSKDDGGIILLEDFAQLRNSPLDHSLDVPAVRKGMAGKTMAQRQFYFVDACRVRPRGAVDYQSLGNGVGLQNPFEGAPDVSAVYFSASPSSEALAEPGRGTLFLQALMDCVELAAVDDHLHQSGWVVTTATLMHALPRRIAELAKRLGLEQTATTGGQLADVVFHVLPGAPEVPLTLELEPPEAAVCAIARLWDGVGTTVFDGERFSPTLARPVPAGHYVLTVRIEPPTAPYHELQALPVPALPPACRQRVPVQ
jgi:Caspase domain